MGPLAKPCLKAASWSACPHPIHLSAYSLGCTGWCGAHSRPHCIYPCMHSLSCFCGIHPPYYLSLFLPFLLELFLFPFPDSPFPAFRSFTLFSPYFPHMKENT
jgi:hypothetical protein